jgi:prophage maintenance system killer protein
MRAAWVAVVLYIDLNGGRWGLDLQDVDDAEHTMIAAGELDEATDSDWLRARVRFT